MQIQAAIIQIDCPHNRLFIIACEYLCMHKAGCIFINPHPRLEQLLIMALCQCEYKFLIRNMR